jgi:protein O-mannosyl-transferase
MAKKTTKIPTPPAPQPPRVPQNAKLKTQNPPPQYAPSFWREYRLPILIVAILSFILYAQSMRFDYALDDLMVIQKNQFTQKGFAGIGDIFRYESFRGYFGEQKQLLEGDRYRPLSIATFAAEVSLFGAGAKGVSHFLNILLYILSNILLYRVLLFLFPVDKPVEKPENGFKNVDNSKNTEGGKNSLSSLTAQLLTVPFLATALFAVHPLHVEVVANIKGRDEILALMGELGALYCTFRYLESSHTKFLWGAFVAFLVGIFSKESAITFLAIVPLTAHFFTKATNSDKLKVTLPILAGTVIYLLARLNAIGYLLDNKVVTDLMNNPFYGMTAGERLATTFYTLLIYMKLHILPHPLTHDYYPFHIPKMNWSDWQILLSLAIHAVLGVVILRGWQQRSVWAYAAAFYVLALSIVSNLVVSVGTFMNERFVYHASIGFCLAAAYFLIKKLPNKVGLAVAAVLLIGFSAKTMLRVPDWFDGNSLNAAAIQVSPNSARANCFYGISLWENKFLKMSKTATNEQKLAVLNELKPYFERSLDIYPNYSSALKMWTGVVAEYHKLDGDLDKYLSGIDRVNKAGIYEPFIFQYFDYLNGRAALTKTDAEKLKNFYAAWLSDAQKNQGTTILPQEIQKLIRQIDGRVVN